MAILCEELAHWVQNKMTDNLQMTHWNAFSSKKNCEFRFEFHWNMFGSPTLDCDLTHWGRVMHKCVSKLTIIGSDNGLSPGRRQAIIWTNAGILLIGPLGTNFSEILIEIYTFSLKKIHFKVSSGKWLPSCLGLNVLNNIYTTMDP